MKYRILVTGSRYMRDRKPIREMLERVLDGLPWQQDIAWIQVVHGAARGADSLTDEVLARDLLDLGLPPAEKHPANWKKFNNRAGPIRNSKMAKLGANICLAFPCPRSVGTWDMVQKIALTGCEVWIRPLRRGEYKW